jgi:Gluconate 2-dehydrogenase subunit 3
MNPKEPVRIDRRVAIKWMLTASAGMMLVRTHSFGADVPDSGKDFTLPPHAGYGTDPDLMKAYKPGDIWPLTLTDAQRRCASSLCDVVIPADAHSPSASSVGVTDFIDEWVSAPYPNNVEDRKTILGGLAWLDDESKRRFGSLFADATDDQRQSLCEEISHDSEGDEASKAASKFFKRYRNLTASGFYTTPVGMKDLGYVGNVPLARFDGPPADLVAKLGLTDEVKW